LFTSFFIIAQLYIYSDKKWQLRSQRIFGVLFSSVFVLNIIDLVVMRIHYLLLYYE